MLSIDFAVITGLLYTIQHMKCLVVIIQLYLTAEGELYLYKYIIFEDDSNEPLSASKLKTSPYARHSVIFLNKLLLVVFLLVILQFSPT